MQNARFSNRAPHTTRRIPQTAHHVPHRIHEYYYGFKILSTI